MKITILKLFITSFLTFSIALSAKSQDFQLRNIKSYPFPTSLTTAATGSKIAWAIDKEGKRNIYVSEGPNFKTRQLTNNDTDDGQEISSLSISADGKWVVFIKGGDHGSNWNDAAPVNANAAPQPPKVQIHSISFDGRKHLEISEGENPVISPNSDVILFTKNGQAWTAPIDGSSPAKQLFSARGTTGDLRWAPDASAIAFVSNRQDHSFIGVYTDQKTPIKWISPSFYRDRSPRWSPDGTGLVFIRTAGIGGAPEPILSDRHQPWSIWKADLKTGTASQLWKAPTTLAGSIPNTHGGTNLHWAANNRIVFLSTHDGWPHLYSLPVTGGTAILLSPGAFMVEHITLSPDKKWLYYSANTGTDKKDIDRRHIARVPVDKAAAEVLSPGTDMEWTPMLTGDAQHLIFITTIGQQPPLPAIIETVKVKRFAKNITLLSKENIPVSFPTAKLTAPEQVIFNAPDGQPIHAQLFKGRGTASKKPAIIYIHGGPSRQMLLGWNYSEYYTNAYALNQYLASLGFNVLSVNYRLGIGYGYDFHHAKNGGTAGVSEYQDIKAAAEWLASQNNTDPKRIGVYGGSYGGYLTNMALAKDSKLFAAGVSIHGLGDRTIDRTSEIVLPDRYEKAPDAEKAVKVAWESSPVAYLDTWTSPVLLIHGDDDRNVPFNQSTDLNKRLEERGIPVETLVIVDDTHHWMKYENVMKVNQATADFFIRKLKPEK